jgi:hypothetical protein
MHGINEAEHNPIQFEKKVARMSAATCGITAERVERREQFDRRPRISLRSSGLLATRPHYAGGTRNGTSRYFDAESFDIRAIASWTVVMNWAGKIIVEFFSIEISAMVCRVRS